MVNCDFCEMTVTTTTSIIKITVKIAMIATYQSFLINKLNYK